MTISLRAHLKRISSLGGIARAKKLSAARRKEIATKASHARKNGKLGGRKKGVPLKKKPPTSL